jgi:hypothetical protein
LLAVVLVLKASPPELLVWGVMTAAIVIAAGVVENEVPMLL